MFFFRADESEGQILKSILARYAQASGQTINLQKSGIMFSNNVLLEDRLAISSLLGVSNALDTGRYLGLPSLIGRNKKQIFSYLKDRIWVRLQAWRKKPLSKAGCEILIKSVAQSIPTFGMSTFLLPSSLADELQRMINSFWWGRKSNSSRGLNWFSWERLCIQKEFGGLGFRDFYGFNLAMLGKQGCKLLNDPNATICRIYKAKYYPRGDFLNANLGHNPSFAWRSILAFQVLIKKGL
ncbi:uncharacterized mitochondrial protein AtMg00310-like [Henckelia pumila]|uniref:uncharacterized mitochondrial protein AtMg00310-like n=1 Tax=Henckelia pumila TaxID=405737 RepID=UPI003C6DF111